MTIRMSSLLVLGSLLMSGFLMMPAGANHASSSISRDHLFSGTGAWRIVFEVDPDNDLQGSIHMRDAVGATTGEQQSSYLLAILHDREFESGLTSRGAQGAGDVAYVSAQGETIEVGPLGNDGVPGGSEDWSGFNGLGATQSVEILFLYASPEAAFHLNASWTHGVTLRSEGPAAAVAWLASDFPEGVSTGAQFGPTASLALRGNLSTHYGLVGWFGVSRDFGFTASACSSPSDPQDCHNAARPEGIFLDTTPGTWAFRVDADARGYDPRVHVLLAVLLPPPP